MKFISKRIALVVVMLVSLYVSVISADTIRMAYYAAPQTVDPYKSSASPTASLNEHIYEALVSRTDKKFTGYKLALEGRYHPGIQFT